MDQADRWASRTLRLRVKAGPARQWQLAARCGMSPSVVTALIQGYRPVPLGDPRVMKLAEAVGLAPERAFSKRPPTSR